MKSSFDYVIVGAGSAGCVLAHRLSAEPDTSVLLLEAGGQTTGVFKDMPIAFPRYVLRRDLNWNFQSEPEPHADNRVIEVPRGKALGARRVIYYAWCTRAATPRLRRLARAGLTAGATRTCCPTSAVEAAGWGWQVYGGDGPLEVCIPQTTSCTRSCAPRLSRQAFR
jgi:choline dehydrogenase